MQLKIKVPVLLVGLMLVLTAGAWAGPATNPGNEGSQAPPGPRPQAVFPETKYEFEPLFEGDDVIHDFVVENKGDAPLVIKNVKPG